MISLLEPTAFQERAGRGGCAGLRLSMQPGVANPLGFVRLLALLRKLRPQVLHSHMFHANLLARLARLLYPVPVLISTLHSIAESGAGIGQDRVARPAVPRDRFACGRDRGRLQGRGGPALRKPAPCRRSGCA